MSQLTFSTVPSPADLADSTFNAGQALVGENVAQIAENARTAAVRPEVIYMGWFKDGDVIPAPVSDVDGYIYSPVNDEVRFIKAGFTTQPPGIFSSGQKLRPYANPSQGLKIDWWFFDIDDSTGEVLCNVYYESADPGFPGGGASGLTSDGMIKVLAICTRSSVNSDGGTN